MTKIVNGGDRRAGTLLPRTDQNLRQKVQWRRSDQCAASQKTVMNDLTYGKSPTAKIEGLAPYCHEQIKTCGKRSNGGDQIKVLASRQLP